MKGCEDVGPWAGRPRAQMRKSDEVEAMLHLRALGWGLRRIAKEFGCSKNTVRRYVAADGWMTYSRRAGGGKLEDQETWLKERFFQHGGNAEVVRQDLVREQGIDVSLRTVERAVAPFRRLLTAEAKATVRFETPPGRQLQVDFGQRRVPIAGERVRVFLFVATLGYSRRCHVATFRHERQSSWFRGLEGAFHHFGGVTREVLLDNPRGRWWSSTTCRLGRSSSTTGSWRSRPTGGSVRARVRRTGPGRRGRTSAESATSKQAPSPDIASRAGRGWTRIWGGGSGRLRPPPRRSRSGPRRHPAAGAPRRTAAGPARRAAAAAPPRRRPEADGRPPRGRRPTRRRRSPAPPTPRRPATRARRAGHRAQLPTQLDEAEAQPETARAQPARRLPHVLGFAVAPAAAGRRPHRRGPIRPLGVGVQRRQRRPQPAARGAHLPVASTPPAWRETGRTAARGGSAG